MAVNLGRFAFANPSRARCQCVDVNPMWSQLHCQGAGDLHNCRPRAVVGDAHARSDWLCGSNVGDSSAPTSLDHDARGCPAAAKDPIDIDRPELAPHFVAYVSHRPSILGVNTRIAHENVQAAELCDCAVEGVVQASRSLTSSSMLMPSIPLATSSAPSGLMSLNATRAPAAAKARAMAAPIP